MPRPSAHSSVAKKVSPECVFLRFGNRVCERGRKSALSPIISRVNATSRGEKAPRCLLVLSLQTKSLPHIGARFSSRNAVLSRSDRARRPCSVATAGVSRVRARGRARDSFRPVAAPKRKKRPLRPSERRDAPRARQRRTERRAKRRRHDHDPPPFEPGQKQTSLSLSRRQSGAGAPAERRGSSPSELSSDPSSPSSAAGGVAKSACALRERERERDLRPHTRENERESARLLFDQS